MDCIEVSACCGAELNDHIPTGISYCTECQMVCECDSMRYWVDENSEIVIGGGG